MTRRMTFGLPREVTNPGDDSRSLLFPFSVVPAELVGAPEERQSTTDHRLIVTVTNNRLPAWHLTDLDLVRVLFEIGRRQVSEQLRAGALQREYRVLVSTHSHSSTCPFDPAHIPNPHGAVYEVEEERRIGFK